MKVRIRLKAKLLICLSVLVFLAACGVDEVEEPGDSVLYQDVQDYIADCLDSDAQIFSFDMTQRNREGAGFSAACEITYGTGQYSKTAVFALEYALENENWMLRRCSVEMGSPETTGNRGICGETLSWELDENGVLTIGGTGKMFDYEYKDEVVDTPWWEHSDEIQSIVIANGVTSIGAFAFCSCKNLTKMTMPESIIQIGNNAFASSSLKSIIFEGKAPAFGDNVFMGVTATVFYPTFLDGWTNDRMMDYGGSIAWVELSEGEMMSLLTDNQIIGGTCGPELNWTLNEDGILLISGTGEMDEIDYDFDSGRTSTPWWDVRDRIQTVFLMNGISDIGDYAFYDCPNLSRVEMANSITKIGYDAFQDCKKLTNITLPKGVSSITPSIIFYGCESLCSIDVVPGNEKYASVDGILFDKNKTKLVYYPRGKSASSYSIPDGVTEISSSAFSNCINLSSVTIPESVTCIGASAFYNCTNLKSATIPDGVVEISGSTFEKCTSMSSVVIPSSVTTIGRSAFYHCESLTNITIPDNVTEIESCAFSDCDKLESVVIPGSLSIMGERVFEGCASLKYVTIEEGATMLGEAAFEYCISLTSVTLPSSITKLSGYLFSGCSKLENITIPSGVTTIFNYAFSDCNSLTSVVIPASVTLIGNGAFRRCDNLEEVTFEGDAPEFKGDVFDSTSTNAYYSASCSGWTSDVKKNYGGWVYWYEKTLAE